MNDYVLLIGERGRSRRTPPGLVRIEAGGWLTLFGTSRPSLLFGNKGLLIGQLFERRSHRPVRSNLDIDSIFSLAPDDLLHFYWGNYVLVRETSIDTVEILRDPSGSLPCFIGRKHGELFLASDAVAADRLSLLGDARPDLEQMAEWLQFPFLRGTRTMLAGVDEAIPGSLLELGPRRSLPRQAWRPARFAASANAHVDSLFFRRLVTDCVTAQIGDRPALLQLSGGLDSSIVAACLRSVGSRFNAVTFATRSRDGDEVKWARMVCDHLGIALAVVRENEAICLPPSILSFRPGVNLLMAVIDHLLELHREEVGAALLFDGGAGDSLFGYSATAAPVVDAFGAGHGWRTLSSVAAHSGASWWRVLRASLRQAWRPSAYLWHEDRSFLEPDALRRSVESHPWLADIMMLPPGKAEHLASLVHIQHFLDRHAIGGEHRHPLFCQPLIEVCLGIPSWRWNALGQDRLVARQAFADALPLAITTRRTKGSLEGFVHRRFDALKASLSELILDGALAKSGLINRSAAEAALRSSADGSVKMRLSEIATLEHWLASWRARAR